MTRTQRLLGPFKEFGLFAGLIYGIARILSLRGSRFRVFFYEFMAQPIAAAPLLPEKLRRVVDIHEIPRNSAAYAEMPLTPDVLAFRFRQNTVCLGAFQQDVLVGYMWLSFTSYDEDEVHCTYMMVPADKSVWDFDFYLRPEHRTGLAFIALWDGANTYLRDRGVNTSFSRVSRFNTASRKSHKHLKWVRIGRAVFLRAQRFQLMVSTCAPFLHLSTMGLSHPKIIVTAPLAEGARAVAKAA